MEVDRRSVITRQVRAQRKAEERKEHRSKRVVEFQVAGRKLMRERGTMFSVEEVAKSAGLSVGAFYLYFKSKDDFLVSLLGDLRVPEKAQPLAFFAGNYFEVFLRLASSDLQELSEESKDLVAHVITGLSDSLKAALGEELALRARRAALKARCAHGA